MIRPNLKEEVPEAQVLPLVDAKCNNQPCGGRGSVTFLASTADTADKVVIAAASVTVATTNIADENCARATTTSDKSAGLD